MSKQGLQQSAFKSSGVKYEESLEASKLEPPLYDRIGGEEGFLKLSQLFYDRVFDDTESQWFLGIFASSTKAESVDNQVRMFECLYDCIYVSTWWIELNSGGVRKMEAFHCLRY